MGRLSRKSAIVTGAGSGIGQASALIFAREGAKVLAVDLSDEGLADTAAQAAKEKLFVKTTKADVGEEADIEKFVADCIEDFGDLDVFFANAGVPGGTLTVMESTPEMWNKTLRVNLVGCAMCVKHAARHMVSQGKGSIICTASTAGIRANAGGAHYSASKAGVISLVQTTAYQLTGTNVRVNAVCPGLIETGMTRRVFDAARAKGTEDRIGQLNPLQRYGHPEEIAYMALFLASDEASYVNGQFIAVDGGLSASHPWVYPRKK
jgi:NAD(P)-dependent dehydrogenase (short-subunit alcohol dehydrogenase family)